MSLCGALQGLSWYEMEWKIHFALLDGQNHRQKERAASRIEVYMKDRRRLYCTTTQLQQPEMEVNIDPVCFLVIIIDAIYWH